MVDPSEEELGWARQALHLKVQRPSQEEKNRRKMPTMPRAKLRLTVLFKNFLLDLLFYVVHIFCSCVCTVCIPGAHEDTRSGHESRWDWDYR